MRSMLCRAAALAAVACFALHLGARAEEAEASKASPSKAKVAKFTAGPKSTGAVGLTFDDGPHPKLTMKLVELLKAENVQATFFMLGGQVEKFPEIARAVAEAGFELGNHSWSHADLTKLSADEVKGELERTQQIIEQATGKRPTLFRPPYGNVNAKVAAVAEELGLDIVSWSVDPRDWQPGTTSERIKTKILNESVGGSIVCIHDIHSRTVDAIPAIVAGLREKQLGFATAGALIEAEKADREKRKADAASGGGSASAGAESEPPAPPPTIPLDKTRFKRPAPPTAGQ